jgi:hypothetical protein
MRVECKIFHPNFMQKQKSSNFINTLKGILIIISSFGIDLILLLLAFYDFLFQIYECSCLYVAKYYVQYILSMLREFEFYFLEVYNNDWPSHPSQQNGSADKIICVLHKSIHNVSAVVKCLRRTSGC